MCSLIILIYFLYFFFFFFFFNDTATTEIYTLSLHDALPICFQVLLNVRFDAARARLANVVHDDQLETDRKSTRLNSSHEWNSYAVRCLKKKKRYTEGRPRRQVYSAEHRPVSESVRG